MIWPCSYLAGIGPVDLGRHRRSLAEVQERDDRRPAVPGTRNRPRGVRDRQRASQSRSLNSGLPVDRERAANRPLLHRERQPARVGLNHGDRRAHRHPEQARRVRFGQERGRVRGYQVTRTTRPGQRRKVGHRERRGGQPAEHHKVASPDHDDPVGRGQPAGARRLPRRPGSCLARRRPRLRPLDHEAAHYPDTVRATVALAARAARGRRGRRAAGVAGAGARP